MEMYDVDSIWAYMIRAYACLQRNVLVCMYARCTFANQHVLI